MSYIYATIKKAVEEETHQFECISRRYKFPFCLLLIYVDGADDISELITSNTRCADKFIKIDEHYYALLFFANRADSYITVTNKLMFVLEKHYPTAKIAMGVACKYRFDDGDIVSKALQNVLRAVDSSMNTIIDEF